MKRNSKRGKGFKNDDAWRGTCRKQIRLRANSTIKTDEEKNTTRRRERVAAVGEKSKDELSTGKRKGVGTKRKSVASPWYCERKRTGRRT